MQTERERLLQIEQELMWAIARLKVLNFIKKEAAKKD